MSRMNQDEGLQNVGSVVETPSPGTPTSRPTSQHDARISSSSTEQAEDDEHDLQNMEELAPVNTGPAYSVFSSRRKKYIVIMVTCASFISPTSANIYFPALIPLRNELNVSATLINLTLTSYMIFQGLAPTIVGDLADMGGRRPAYIITFIIYLGANIGLALQDSYAALFILRCLQSTGSSGAIALGFGVVADIATSSERGTYMGIVGAGTMLGPAIGPVIGGILTQFLGWRSIFWFLVIFSGLFLIPYALTVPETGRNVVGNGSVPPQGWNMSIIEWLHFRKEEKAGNGLSRTATAEGRRLAQAELARHRKLRWPNPLKTIHIIMEKDMAVVLIYNAIIYTAFYDIMASMPRLFHDVYGFNDLQIGLCYIPFGCGCAIASYVNGKMLDWNYKRVAGKIGFSIDRKHGDDLRHFPIERARLEIIGPILTVGLISVLCYGWVFHQRTHLSAPLILLFFAGLCVNGAFNILSVLVVDLYPQSPSTATAANNLVRCFMGAGGTAVIDIMIDAMGVGWCFTFISLVCAAASPMLWVALKWGPTWREERRVRLEHMELEEKSRNDAAEADLEATVEGEVKT